MKTINIFLIATLFCSLNFTNNYCKPTGPNTPNDPKKDKPSVIQVIINNISKSKSQTEAEQITKTKQKSTSIQQKTSSLLEKLLLATAAPICLGCVLYKVFKKKHEKIEHEIQIIKKALRIFSFKNKK